MKNSSRVVSFKYIFGQILFSAFLFALPLNGLSQLVFEPGTYQGVLRSESDNDESFGFITIKLTASGKFSMRFNLGINKVGQHSYSKTGTFDQNGVYHFEGATVTESSYAIASVIDLQLSDTTIQGTVTDGTHTSTIELERLAVFSAANPPPAAGRYTFLIANPGDENLPVGSGYGTATVSSRGKISASGRSADEKTFQQSASLTVSGRWPVFVKLSGTTKGILCGWLGFEETADSDFAGALTWLGPEVPGPNHAFVNEFSGGVAVVGSRYLATKGNSVLQTTSSADNVHLMLSGGGLEMPIDRDLTLSTANKFTFSNKLPGDSLSVSASKGTFTGTFLHSDGTRETFRGAILQKQNLGGGHFVDRDGEPGNVELVPQDAQ